MTFNAPPTVLGTAFLADVGLRTVVSSSESDRTTAPGFILKRSTRLKSFSMPTWSSEILTSSTGGMWLSILTLPSGPGELCGMSEQDMFAAREENMKGKKLVAFQRSRGFRIGGRAG